LHAELPPARGERLGARVSEAGHFDSTPAQPVSLSPAVFRGRAPGLLPLPFEAASPLVHPPAGFSPNCWSSAAPLAPPPLRFAGTSVARIRSLAVGVARALAGFQPVLAARSFPDAGLTDLLNRLLYPEALAFPREPIALRLLERPAPGLRLSDTPQPLGFRWRRKRAPWDRRAVWKASAGRFILPRCDLVPTPPETLPPLWRN